MEVHVTTPTGDFTQELPFESYEYLMTTGRINLHRIVETNPSCVYFATSHCKEQMVKLFLEHGANPSPSDSRGITPLHICALKKSPEIAKILVQAGADTTAVDTDGATALHMAAAVGSNEVILVLLAAGSEVNAQTERGETPLCMAAWGGRVTATRMLLRGKANPQLETNLGLVPLECAVRKGHTAVVKMLGEEVGFGRCSGSTKGERSLRYAADVENTDILRILREGGVEDAFGHALCTTVHLGNEESLEILLSTCENPSEYVNASHDPSTGYSLLECFFLQDPLRASSCRHLRRLLDAGLEDRDVLGQDVLSFTNLRICNMESRANDEGELFGIRGILRVFLQEPAIHALSWMWPSKMEKLEVTNSKRGGFGFAVNLFVTTKTKRVNVLLAALSRKKEDGAFVGYCV